MTTSVESTQVALADTRSETASGEGEGADDRGENQSSANGTVLPVAAAPTASDIFAQDEGPAQATSVGLWGPTGMGKTQFAATLLQDPGYAPALYIDNDGGRPALAGYEEADLLVHRACTDFESVIRLIAEVQAGRIKNRAGRRVRSVIIDAITKLIPVEIKSRGLIEAEPKDQAQKLAAPCKVFFGQLTQLPLAHGITTVHIAHSKDYSVKVGDVVHDLIKPDLWKSICGPWMSSLRHLWRVTKTPGAKGPAYPIVMLRTEPNGVYGTPLYEGWMKTSNIAFSQWLAGRAGKRQHLQWDTGTMPIDQHPTLADLLRTAEGLAFNQGVIGATNPHALRAYASLQAAMEAAGAE